jgi:iron complex outermembrane receptor protein
MKVTKFTRNKLSIAISLMLSASALMPASLAQAAEETGAKKSWGLEEVMVTAQRRSEKSQDVPMSVIALSADAMEKMGFSNITDIADKVPSLSIQPDFVQASALKVYIRGVGQEQPTSFERDSGVGIYLDDVYVGHGNGLASELNDIERIEVLSGPQGILYGRNSVGGAVKFISAKPTGELGFKQKIDAGEYGLKRFVSTLNLPEFMNLSSKLTIMRSEKDGWVKNSGSAGNPGDKKATGLRLALNWSPVESLSVDYSYDQMDHEGISNYQQHGYPKYSTQRTNLPELPDRQDKTWRTIDVNIHDDFEGSGHALTALWDVSENLSLKSITGYREFESDGLHDGTESYNTSTLVLDKADQDQFSQEFLLSGFSDDGSLKYHVGLYYFTESVRQVKSSLVNNGGDIADAIDAAIAAGDPIIAPTEADLRPRDSFDIENESVAVYTQVTWTPSILDQRLTLDLGARYTEDDRYLAWNKPSFIGTAYEVDDRDSASSSSFDPAFTVDYAWTDNVHSYLRYAQAYRSGGFDAGAQRLQDFDPETLESVEIGLKSKILDERLLLNMAVFQLDYEDIQIQFFDNRLGTNEPPAKVTVNAASATTKGVEIELKYIPTDGLMLSGAATYLDSSTTVSNPFTNSSSERTLFNTPQLKYNLAVEYSFKPSSIGTFSAIVTYDYRDEELASGTFDPKDLKPDYSLVGARLTLSEIPVPEGELNVAVWGKNLADEEYEIYHNFGSVIFGEPRSVGISLNYDY